MDRRPVLIAGGGIGGLCVALTLHQIGVPCLVLESVRHLKPLGVGINLQPNAVRELYELGIGPEQLDAIGLQTREFVLVGLERQRGVRRAARDARRLQVAAIFGTPRRLCRCSSTEAVVERLGADAVRTGMAVTGYRNDAGRSGVRALVETRDGERLEIEGSLLIGADGLHSAVRAQMHPTQPPIQWGGAIMWRGVTPGLPIRTGASFVGLGTHRHRVVFYPISNPDPVTGLAADQLDRRDHRRQLGRVDDRRLEPAGGASSRSSITSRTGTTTGWTFRPCSAAPMPSSSIR